MLARVKKHVLLSLQRWASFGTLKSVALLRALSQRYFPNSWVNTFVAVLRNIELDKSLIQLL